MTGSSFVVRVLGNSSRPPPCPPHPMTASTSPRLTESPALRTIRFTRPSTGAGTSPGAPQRKELSAQDFRDRPVREGADALWV